MTLQAKNQQHMPYQPAAGKNSKKFKKVQKSSKIDRSSESSDHTLGKDMK